MSHLEYQTPFHPGPFGQQGGQPSYAPSVQNQLQQHQPHPTHSSPAAAPQPSSQGFAPAPSYPGAVAPNLARPPPPFHDGLMQHAHAPHFSPAAASFPGAQQSYTSAPFAQSVTATSASPTPPLQQQQQQQQAAVRHSASPQQLTSPYAGPPQHHFQQQQGQPGQQFQQPPPKQQTPPTKYPMAAPPLPQTPAAAQHASASSATGSPQAPQSPSTQAREQKRIELLLEINIELLQEINNLQAQGRGGAMNPQHQVQLRQVNMDDSMASEEYIHCLRRVQANLAYLAPRADVQQALKAPPGPAHMTPPAHMPQLQPKYEQLKELFPGWPGHEGRMAQNAGSPRTNSMNGMNPPTAQA